MNAPPPPTGLPTKAPLARAAPLPRLDVLPPSAARKFFVPVKRIHDSSDVTRFHSTRAYRDICTFILQLNQAVCPRIVSSEGQKETEDKVLVFSLTTPRQDPVIVQHLQALLSRVEAIIDEVPPSTAPRRFGNVSFRTWHQKLEHRIAELLREYLPFSVLKWAGGSNTGAEYPTVLDELKEYFVGGFGSPSRLDYGTGHELSFIAFLGCLWKLGAFTGPSTLRETLTLGPDEVERSIVFGVIEPYLSVIRKLITTYTLEPAGSHGVWGLDDHSFIPYIFGSAQLTRPIRDNSTEPMPQEGSCPGAPQPKQIIKPEIVEKYRKENMYFSAIGFIYDVKSGPFWEHSPTLFDISGVKDGWGKINKGMIKMYNAEVLGKFPVVQHFPFGSIFEWESDPLAVSAAAGGAGEPVDAPGATTQVAAQGAAAATAARGVPPATGTVAPWSHVRVPEPPSGIPPPPAGVHIPTRAPWGSEPRR